jgi:hypothetical protein
VNDAAIAEARRRAHALLAGTEYFEALGLAKAAADARALARLTLDLIDALEAERSARVSIQAARDRLLETRGTR